MKGFYYINDLCAKLAEYEMSRDRYGSFEEFYPELVNVFRDLSERNLGEDYYSLSYTGPVNMLYNMRLPIILVYPTGEADQNAQNAVRKHVKGVKTLLENNFVLDIEIMSDEEALKSDLTNKNILCMELGGQPVPSQVF